MAVQFSNEYIKYYDNKSQVISDINSIEFSDHYKKWDYFSSNHIPGIGQLFLYEKIEFINDSKLYYPKIGIYLHATPCDQTIEIEWASYRRTYEWNTEIKEFSDGKEYTFGLYEVDTRLEHLILWHDSILIYGVWDKLPTWKELRPYYEKTWWFHKSTQQMRDISINNILR